MYQAFTQESSNPAHVYLFLADEAKSELEELPEHAARFAQNQKFSGKAGQLVLVPNEDGQLGYVIGGLGDGRDPLAVASLAASLVAGDYHLARMPEAWSFSWVAAGWADGAYRFDRYLSLIHI